MPLAEYRPQLGRNHPFQFRQLPGFQADRHPRPVRRGPSRSTSFTAAKATTQRLEPYPPCNRERRRSRQKPALGLGLATLAQPANQRLLDQILDGHAGEVAARPQVPGDERREPLHR